MDCIDPPSSTDLGPVLVLGTVRVALGSGEITRSGGADRLRPIEHALLQRLYREHGGVVSRERLLVEVWGFAPASASRTLEATVARLRALLDDSGSRQIVTIHGVGYALIRPPPIPERALVVRDDLLERAAGWIQSHPGRWLTLVGAPGVGKSGLLRSLAAQRHLGDLRVYVDVEVEGRAALEDVLSCEAGPRLVFADLGGTDPSWLADRPPSRHAHTVVIASRTPLDDRHEAILQVSALPDDELRP